MSHRIKRSYLGRTPTHRSYDSGARSNERTPQTFRFSIKPQPFEALLASAHFGTVSKHINRGVFSAEPSAVGEFEARYVSVRGARATPEKSQKYLESLNCGSRPWHIPSLEHLIAFAAKFPDEQRKFPIVCLGSTGDIDDCVFAFPAIGMDDKEPKKRAIVVGLFHGGPLGRGVRMLVVRPALKA